MESIDEYVPLNQLPIHEIIDEETAGLEELLDPIDVNIIPSIIHLLCREVILHRGMLSVYQSMPGKPPARYVNSKKMMLLTIVEGYLTVGC